VKSGRADFSEEVAVKITILRDKCVGSGNCVELAGRFFDQDYDDGKVVLLGSDDVPEDSEVRQAALLCPVGAILIDGMEP
jgi:ferredoxin